jgi:hypothetical protein
MKRTRVLPFLIKKTRICRGALQAINQNQPWLYFALAPALTKSSAMRKVKINAPCVSQLYQIFYNLKFFKPFNHPLQLLIKLGMESNNRELNIYMPNWFILCVSFVRLYRLKNHFELLGILHIFNSIEIIFVNFQILGVLKQKNEKNSNYVLGFLNRLKFKN